jgi:hypothetical protein
VAFDVSRIPFPDLGLRDGGYGSSIVPVGRLPRVVLSLPSGGVKVPLACVDLETGKVTTARGLLGEVRDGSIDEEGQGWLLTSSALVRVDVSAAPRILDVARPKGLGRHRSRMLELGDGRFGLCNRLGRSLAVVNPETGVVDRHIRTDAPYAARVESNRVTLYSPHGGRWTTMHGPDLEQLDSGPMPTGTSVLLDGEDAVLVVGERRPIPHSKSWEIAPTGVGVYDAATFAERRCVRVQGDPREVLGQDDQQRVVVGAGVGVLLIDRDTLAEVARYEVDGKIEDIAYLSAHRAAVISVRWPDRELLTVRW